MDELNDLLKAAQANDLDATGELLERFQGMAAGYAYSLLDDPHLAEDAVQAAYFEACQQLAGVYSAAAFPAWLRRLVFKQCDRIRRKRKAQTIAVDEETLPGNGQDAATALEEHERLHALRRTLAALPELERQVTLLHYFHQRSRGEVAAFLELTPDQVAYRLRSARRLFKEHLTHMSDSIPSDLTAVGKDAFQQIGQDAPPELAHYIGQLGENISLGLVAKDGGKPNLLRHSIEVAELAGLLAERLGLDPAKAQRAGLLHDMGKVLGGDHMIHAESGAEKAAALGEDPEVVAAIADHHARGERLEIGCFLIDIDPLCFALRAADFIAADRFVNGDEADPRQLADQFVELDGDDLRLHGFQSGDNFNILAQGPVADRRAAALEVTERVRAQTGFSKRVCVTLAPS